MGSFANSFHIKSNDSLSVAATVKSILHADGYELTDESSSDGMRDNPSVFRAIYVSREHDGWVSLLDSDPMNSISLAIDLSRELKCQAIHFTVNDSDSWHYQFHDAGIQIDEFDSLGDENEIQPLVMTPDVIAMLNRGDRAGFQQAVEQRMERVKQNIRKLTPPEILAIEEKLKDCVATDGEIQKYNEWFRTKGASVHTKAFKFSFPKARKTKQRDYHSYVERLRPLLKTDITEDQVLEALSKQALFAERALEEFLPLIGIAPFYANLSYTYMEQCNNDELSNASIAIANHLKFIKP